MGMRCLAIDPGASTGWAVFDAGVLVACGACKPEEAHVRVAQGPFEAVLVEKPQKYPNDGIDPNRLITLALSAGIAVGPFLMFGARLDTVRPKDWKGQVPKPIHHPRIYASLSAQEQGRVSAAGKGLNAKALGDMMDAVGLGRYAVTHGLWR